jgi:hypothetical protein
MGGHASSNAQAAPSMITQVMLFSFVFTPSLIEGNLRCYFLVGEWLGCGMTCWFLKQKGKKN